jgi:hypothetical protein
MMDDLPDAQTVGDVYAALLNVPYAEIRAALDMLHTLVPQHLKMPDSPEPRVGRPAAPSPRHSITGPVFRAIAWDDQRVVGIGVDGLWEGNRNDNQGADR